MQSSTDGCTFHPSNTLEQPPGRLSMWFKDKSERLSLTCRTLPVLLSFYLLPLCPWNKRQHIRVLLSREYEASFSDTVADTVPEHEHEKGEQIQGVTVTSVFLYSLVWMDSCRSDGWLDLFLWISRVCFVRLQQRLPLLYPPPLSPPLQQLRGKRNSRERPQQSVTRQLQREKKEDGPGLSMRQQPRSWRGRDVGMTQGLKVHWDCVGEEKEFGGGASGTGTMITQLWNLRGELVEEEPAVNMTVCISEAREEILKEWLTSQRERSHECVSCCQLIRKHQHWTEWKAEWNVSR